MSMRARVFFIFLALGAAFSGGAQAQGFAALVSPPRFELAAAPGKTLRSVIEVSNRSTTPARYLLHTADWSFAEDFSVNFQDELQADSCRPWVAIERPEVVVPGGGTLRYRFEVTVPADAPPGECRFAVMIEGAEPSIARSEGLDMPVTGRIGVIVYLTVGDGAPDLRDIRAQDRAAERSTDTGFERAQLGQRPRPHDGISDRQGCEGSVLRFHALGLPHPAARAARRVFDPLHGDGRSPDSHVPSDRQRHAGMGQAED